MPTCIMRACAEWEASHCGLAQGKPETKRPRLFSPTRFHLKKAEASIHFPKAQRPRILQDPPETFAVKPPTPVPRHHVDEFDHANDTPAQQLLAWNFQTITLFDIVNWHPSPGTTCVNQEWAAVFCVP